MLELYSQEFRVKLFCAPTFLLCVPNLIMPKIALLCSQIKLKPLYVYCCSARPPVSFLSGEVDNPRTGTGNGVISYHRTLCCEVDNQETGYQI